MTANPQPTRVFWPHVMPCLCVLAAILGVLPFFYLLITTVSVTPRGQFLQRGRPAYDYEASIQIIMDYARGSHEANDVIFLGGSTCRWGIQPVLFEKLTGLRAYNLGLFGMMEFGGLEVVFRNYLRHHPAPRLLVLCFAPEEITAGEERTGAIKEIYRRVFECFDDTAHVQPASDPPPLIATLRRDARYTYFMANHGIDGHMKVDLSGCSMTYDQLNRTIAQGRGFFGHEGSKPGLDHLALPAFPFVYTPELCQGLASIVRLAQAHGIKVVIRFSPLPLGTSVPHKANQTNEEALRSWSSGLERFCPGAIVNHPEILLFDRAYFIDRMHVNPDGAAVFTAFLADMARPLVATPAGAGKP